MLGEIIPINLYIEAYVKKYTNSSSIWTKLDF